MSSSIEGVAEVHLFRGTRAAADAPPTLLVEIPHGATETRDFTALAAELTSVLPDGLVDFFHVNTDAGAPELGLAVAARFVTEHPSRVAAVLRCRIPRTFIDCNRRIDAPPDDFRAGRVTPGLMPWVTTPADRALLRLRYDQYVGTVRAAVAALPADGAVVALHTYAPRTVDVQVDEHIVLNLRRAYAPEVQPTWPLRPEVDVIGRTVEGVDHAPAGVVEALRRALAAVDLPLAESTTYPLHPSTLAWDHVVARPGRALCVEVRRDLLADPFTPFAQMSIGAAHVERLARPLAAALGAWWPGERSASDPVER